MKAGLPKNHRLVHEIVQRSGTGRHLSASEIFVKASRRQPRIGVATVYRALERLRDLGLISEVRVPGADAAAYEPSGPSHAHFFCSRCGKIEDVRYGVAPRTLKELSAQHGFEIKSERVTFEGRCASCSGR